MRRLYVFVILASIAADGPQEPFPRALVEWKPVQAEPVFKGTGDDASWDKKIRERGYILFDRGVYHLWYTGYNDAKSPNRFLGHATSPDGLNWTRDSGGPFVPDSWVEDMCVVKHEGMYWMFAEGKNDIAHLLSSPNGRDWTELGPLDVRLKTGKPIEPGPYGTPTAWLEDGVWYLFYERRDQGVWLATSKDMKVWTNLQDEPVLKMGPAEYDSTAIATNQIIKQDGWYYTFYHANAHRPWKDWTSNVGRSRDLIHWEKYQGNPLVMNNCSSPIIVDGPKGRRLYTMHPEVRVFESAAPPLGK